MKSSLIITTYNSADYLRLCLQSVIGQTVIPDEIIIADDGSDHQTAELVASFRMLTDVPLLHVWQADRGFRAARSRNNALAVAHGDYIIGIDGDLVLEKHFINDHLDFAIPGHYLKGGRCRLKESFSRELCRRGDASGLNLFSHGIERRRLNLLHCAPLARYLAPRYRRNKPGVLGCNQSFFLDDARAINGYDESYIGWGGEDTDFIRRLRKSGTAVRHLKFAGCAAHLWHKENNQDNARSNLDRSHCPDEELAVRCRTGLDRAVEALESIDLTADTIVFPG